MEPNIGSANKVAKLTKSIIDDYWMKRIKKDEAAIKLNNVVNNPDNYVRIKRGDDYTGVFKNIMGTRRIADFEKLLGWDVSQKGQE